MRSGRCRRRVLCRTWPSHGRRVLARVAYATAKVPVTETPDRTASPHAPIAVLCAQRRRHERQHHADEERAQSQDAQNRHRLHSRVFPSLGSSPLCLAPFLKAGSVRDESALPAAPNGWPGTVRVCAGSCIAQAGGISATALHLDGIVFPALPAGRCGHAGIRLEFEYSPSGQADLNSAWRFRRNAAGDFAGVECASGCRRAAGQQCGSDGRASLGAAGRHSGPAAIGRWPICQRSRSSYRSIIRRNVYNAASRPCCAGRRARA